MWDVKQRMLAWGARGRVVIIYYTVFNPQLFIKYLHPDNQLEHELGNHHRLFAT